MVYGTDAAVQKLAYGNTDSSFDTKTTAALTVATVMINAALNLENDITSPSSKVTQCANLLAAGIILSKPEQPENEHLKLGKELLKSLRGDNPTDAPWRITIPVERFRSYGQIDDRYRLVSD